MTTAEQRRVERQIRNTGFINGLRRLTLDPTKQPNPRERTRNRAALAQLRRGLGKPPGTVPDMYPHVEYALPINASEEDEAPYYLVAALFAWHQNDWPSDDPDYADRYRSNLGASLARLRWQRAVEQGATAPEEGDSTERRFVALLSTASDDLPHHLRQIIGLLRTREVRVNWLQLLADMQDWDAPSRSVQRRWASAFWSQTEPEQPAADILTDTDQGQPAADEATVD